MVAALSMHAILSLSANLFQLNWRGGILGRQYSRYAVALTPRSGMSYGITSRCNATDKYQSLGISRTAIASSVVLTARL